MSLAIVRARRWFTLGFRFGLLRAAHAVVLRHAYSSIAASGGTDRPQRLVETRS